MVYLTQTIENLRRVFEKRLTTAFINAYREPNMSLLADSLKGLASISLQTIAEQTFANEIVRPYMEKVKNQIISVRFTQSRTALMTSRFLKR